MTYKIRFTLQKHKTFNSRCNFKPHEIWHYADSELFMLPYMLVEACGFCHNNS
jgi:hypothetical protein